MAEGRGSRNGLCLQCPDTAALQNTHTSVVFKGRQRKFWQAPPPSLLLPNRRSGGVGRGGGLLQGQAWPWDPAGGDKGPLRVKQPRASDTCMVYNRYLSGIINCIFPKFNIARRGKSFRLVKTLLPHSFCEPARFNCCDKNHKKDQVPTQSIPHLLKNSFNHL